MPNQPLTSRIEDAAAMLRKAQKVAILTGAGVSKESGVPTFRDALEGYWQNYNPEDLATPAAFKRNPRLVWEWYESRRSRVGSVQPNPGHVAIAEIERLLPEVLVITQNVDGLHRRAGSREVIELHGDITQHKCFDDCKGNPTLIDLDSFVWDKSNPPPYCPHCHSAYVRPNVVWFTEALPPDALHRALDFVSRCEVMLVVGTSGVVQPAASLPYQAKRYGGAKVIDVNPLPDEITSIADIFLQGKSGEVLPEMVRLLRA